MVETLLDGRVTLLCGDSLDLLKTLPENSLDSCVTDAPYHLTSIVKRFGNGQAPIKTGKTGAYKRASAGFMGKEWDGGDIAFQPDIWREVYRVLKPGAYVLAFASTRGFGRMSVAIEAAGFVQHPLIALLFDPDPATAAFLNSLSADQFGALSRLVDLADGGLLAWLFGSGFPKATRVNADGFDGYRYGGQSLKPAIEPVFMGQKPFAEKNGTENILKHGTGAVNIDACRVQGGGDVKPRGSSGRGTDMNEGWDRPWKGDAALVKAKNDAAIEAANEKGRWPANVIHDGSEGVLAGFPETGSSSGGGGLKVSAGVPDSQAKGRFYGGNVGFGDNGSAARFFYSAKADADDRIGSKHPTVKPVDLMRYLVRLVTPPGGTVLDCFAGTGTTGEAAFYEGFNAVLCEREPDYQADIRRRMALCLAGPDERKREIIKERSKNDPEDFGPLFAGQS